MLIPYLLNNSRQCFVSIVDKNLTPWNYWRER